MVGLMASGSKNNFLLFMFFLRPKNVNRLPIREGHGVGKTPGIGYVQYFHDLRGERFRVTL